MTKPVFKDEQLDWDTLGDPLMDLGNALAYWVEASIAKSLFHARTFAESLYLEPCDLIAN